MALAEKLNERSNGLCELCTENKAEHEYTVSPKKDDNVANQVALCEACLKAIDDVESGYNWRFLEGSIWSQEPSIQALSYRILQMHKEESWANDVISSVDLDTNTIEWAMSAFEKAAVHKDAFGNLLVDGDTVVLTQALNVKGTNFTASKGTVVKRIKLVHDNPDQIEGKVNEQQIVILCKFVKKQ